jgi:glycosyltransferase involved in cell wall biosynthesis
MLYAGAVIPGRGLEDLIASAPHLARGAYVIMGDAASAAYLESLRRRAAKHDPAGARIHFTPAVPPEEVAALTADATLCIVPTRGVCLSYRFEASNKMFQAIAAGVPLVMTDHPEKRQLAEEHGVGVLCRESDPEDLARAINDLLEDAPRLAAHRDHCRRAAATLNWETESRTLLEIVIPLLPASAGS